MSRADTVIVLDFETTGLSPDYGDRAIEIGAVLIENGKVKDRFQELMNPGKRINGFIEAYTGITNEMLKDARPCKEVMLNFYEFILRHCLQMLGNLSRKTCSNNLFLMFLYYILTKELIHKNSKSIL